MSTQTDELVDTEPVFECPECHHPWKSRLSADRCCTETD